MIARAALLSVLCIFPFIGRLIHLTLKSQTLLIFFRSLSEEFHPPGLLDRVALPLWMADLRHFIMPDRHYGAVQPAVRILLSVRRRKHQANCRHY